MGIANGHRRDGDRSPDRFHLGTWLRRGTRTPMDICRRSATFTGRTPEALWYLCLESRNEHSRHLVRPQAGTILPELRRRLEL